MKIISKITSAAVVLFLIISTATAQNRIGKNDQNIDPFIEKIEYLVDEQANFTFKDIYSFPQEKYFIENPEKPIHLGFTDSALWVKIKIYNPETSAHANDQVLLELRNPLIDIIEIYNIENNGEVTITKTGDHFHFKTRKFNNRNFIFPISVTPGTSEDIYLRIKTSSSMTLPFSVKSSKTYNNSVYDNAFLNGLFYGIILIMIIYNSFLFFSVEDRRYLYYALYVTSYFIYQFSMDGFSFQYLWPGLTWWANKCIPLLTGVACIFAINFSKLFLNLKKKLPRLNTYLSALQMVFLIFIIASLKISYSISIKISGILMMIVAMSLFVSGILSFLKGYRPARFYIIAWTGMISGSVIFGLLRFGAVPNNIFTEYAQHLGSIFEVVLLSFALGDRINIIKKEKEEAQIQAIENLHKADKLKDEFLANTSHELKTPLHGIIGLTDSLIDGIAGELPSKAIHDLTLISSSGKRLSNLVDDLLDYSKLNFKEITITPSAIDLKTLAHGVFELSLPLISDKDIRLINDVKPEDYVHADEDRVKQILFNLINNSIKFTDKGIIKVSSERQGDYISISVMDTGIGIPSHSLERIFESFEQVDGSISRNYGGTGIGLSITRKLVELHGGTIKAESEQGKGSTFIFTLPADTGAIPDTYPETDDTGIETFTPASGRNNQNNENPDIEKTAAPESYSNIDAIRIHIIDDDPVNLEVLKNHLSINRYSVIESSNGIDALKIIKGGAIPDLVLLDIMMPRMSGYEVAKQLRQQFTNYDLPIIMLTAKNQIDDIVAGFTNGANDYLTKPFNKLELLSRIQTHVSLKRAIEKNRKLFAIEKEIELAKKILMSAIPQKTPSPAEIDISVAYIPMNEIGGDYYDFVPVGDDKIGILLADVTGHGIAAALIASMVKIVFNICKHHAESPSRLLEEMDVILHGNMSDNFLTAAYIFIDKKKGTAKFARCGHEPFLFFNRSSGAYREYLPRGSAMGCLKKCSCEEIEVEIGDNDRIVLYSDAIIEARRNGSELFGNENLKMEIIASSDKTAEQFNNSLLDAVNEWKGADSDMEDDYTCIVIDITKNTGN